MWRRGFVTSSSAVSSQQQRLKHLITTRLKNNPTLRRCANSYTTIGTSTAAATTNADLLMKLGATVAACGGGYYLYANEQERLSLYRLGHSTFRILNLVGTTTFIGLDYAISLAIYHRFQRNTIQTEYETKYTLLQKLQGDQQTMTMKMIQCKRMLEDFDRYGNQRNMNDTHSNALLSGTEGGGGTIPAVPQNREQIQQLLHFYQQQILENRQEMEKLSKELESIYTGNQQEDGYEQFYSQLHRRNAKRLRDMCAANGGVYIKIGQHIAMLDHVVPPEYHEYLCTLLANTPTSSMESVRRVFKEDFGGRLPEEIFDEFNPVPIASASLAQVHIAYKDGIKYAIKVQHEGLREGTDIDRYVITTLVHYLHKVFPQFNYDWLTKEMNSNIPPELDFHHECQNIAKAKETLAPFLVTEDIAIPTPITELCSSRVITMTFEEGVYISRIRDCQAYDLNPTEISTLISKVFAEQIFKHGFVHCDPHEANLLVRPHPKNPKRPQIVLLDHGLYRTLEDSFRRDYTRLWQAMILADDRRIERYSRRLNVGEFYTMLAMVLTMKSWDHIVTDDSDKMKTHTSGEDLLMLQAYGRHYHDDIMKLLGVVPSDLLLLLKANDCLRHLDRVLHTPINSTAVFGEAASRIVYEEEMAALRSGQRIEGDGEREGEHYNGGGWWGMMWQWYALSSDYWNVRSRTTALSVFGSVMNQVQTRVNHWKSWRNKMMNFFYVLLGL